MRSKQPAGGQESMRTRSRLQYSRRVLIERQAVGAKAPVPTCHQAAVWQPFYRWDHITGEAAGSVLIVAGGCAASVSQCGPFRSIKMGHLMIKSPVRLGRARAMRMMIQISIPIEAGNEAARRGTFGPAFQKILDALKPEAAYFTPARVADAAGLLCST